LLAGTSDEQIRLFFYDLRIQGLELETTLQAGSSLTLRDYNRLADPFLLVGINQASMGCASVAPRGPQFILLHSLAEFCVSPVAISTAS